MDNKRENKLDRYDLIRKLGVGAFGETYFATEPALGKTVVVKISNTADEKSSQRIRSEARLLGSLNHPNIATLYDVGAASDGRAFLVSEWIEGRSLSDLIQDQHSVPLPDALELTAAICRGLAYAHSKKVIHRDVKPANILVPAINGKPSYGNAKLLDFGLYGMLRPESNTTIAGEFFGTPKYMSPEQIKALKQSPASDVYSLGLVLFEMIYGHTPFEAKTPQQVLFKVLDANIKFPVSPYVPTELQTLIRKCTDKKPVRRPSAIELADRFYELQTSFKSHGEAGLSVPRATRFPHGNPWTRGLFVVLVIVILTLLISLFYGGSIQISRSLLLCTGLALIPASILLGMTLPRFVNTFQPAKQRRVEEVLAGATSREILTKSIAIEVDAVLNSLKRFDEKLLAQTLALMVHEYQSAKESNNRQIAIMNTVQIMEKLSLRLSPWYIRHEKAVAFVVSTVGIISGLATAFVAIAKFITGKP